MSYWDDHCKFLKTPCSIVVPTRLPSHIKKIHEGELMGQFGVDKTLELLKGKFFWPPMRKDVQRNYHRWISCLKTNSKAMSHELYTPSPFASAPWKDISIDFILELPRTTKGFYSIFMVVDRLFFREVVMETVQPRNFRPRR